MTHRTIRTIIEQQQVIAAPADTTVIAAARLMRDHNVGAVMVVEDGRPVGMISARDALGPELEDFIYELLRRNQAEDILA